jgi:ATP-dependent Clp protease protease subunit
MSAEQAADYGLVDNVLNPQNLEGLKSVRSNGESDEDESDE